MTADLFTESVIDIAQQAGEAIMKVYRDDFAVHEKLDRSPLTEADLAAHSLIVAALKELAPDIPILSEESAQIPWRERKKWSRHWLVDPLDGTKEFIKRNGEFTVNIALIEGHEPVLGVVTAPALARTYWALKGRSAFLRGADGEERKLRAKAAPRDSEPWRIVGSRSHGSPAFEEFLKIFERVEVVTMGSSLKLCLVAEGKADLYPRFGPTSQWDTAAAHCIVEAAGGCVIDIDGGGPLRYNVVKSVLNPHFIAGGAERDFVQLLRNHVFKTPAP